MLIPRRIERRHQFLVVKQFQCLYPPPEAEAQGPRARYARRLKTFGTVQQMLNAMARVHVSTLERLLRGLWLPSNPLLLVRSPSDTSCPGGKWSTIQKALQC